MQLEAIAGWICQDIPSYTGVSAAGGALTLLT